MQEAAKNYVVHKFGGSSLADSERFAVVRSILKGENEIIVVSAIKNTTSLLQTALDYAKEKNDYMSFLADIKQSHLSLVDNLLSVDKSQDISSQLIEDINNIKSILHAVSIVGSYSKEIQELVLGYGEQWSAKILTSYLSKFKPVIYIDATAVLFIKEKNGIVKIDWSKSKQALTKFLKNKKFRQIVITGFIAATKDGKRTILGRNGSDFSGAIFAKLFNAEYLYIWTDVDGIYSADPRRVDSAFAIKSMSYLEALELAYFGAKVLHPKTIAPARESNIPIIIKNSCNPTSQGTLISNEEYEQPHIIRGLSCIDNVALINVEGTGMMGVSGIAALVFTILSQVNISIILISQGSSEHSICFAIPKLYAKEAVKVLTENLQHEIAGQQIERIFSDEGCAILAAVGDGLVGTVGIAAKLCTTLANANVNIRAIAQGSSERNISVVVATEKLNRALRAVHSGFYLSNKTISIGLIGPGQIGRTLMRQIQAAQKQLIEKHQVNLCIRGILSRERMLLSQNGADLNSWSGLLANSMAIPNLDNFVDHILADDIPYSVIIDCTASREIANKYDEFIAKGINIITPNKHANSDDIDYYKNLKSLLKEKKCHYLYEATVCAGLPVINTLQDIIKTGDEIIAIEGVLSGTLSYIFSELAEGKSFSSAVIAAKQKGYTEPDPREDLSGIDVARKLICLAREIGIDASLKDVVVHDLVPEELKSGSVDDFLSKLSTYDADMTKLTADANSKNEKLCYVAEISKGGMLGVAIKSFPETQPFSRLKGTDNMLILYTKRYCEQPLIIQGPGAGAEVTAAGVFADLLRLVSYLA